MAAYLADHRILTPVLGTNDVHFKFAKRFQALGLKVYEVPYYRTFLEHGAARVIEDIVRLEEIALLQSHMFRESLAGRLVRARNPNLRHISRVHTHFELQYLAERKWRQWCYYRLESWKSQYVDRYVTISAQVRNDLIANAGIPAERIEVVHNGIKPMGECDPPNNSDGPLPAKAIMIGRFEIGKQQLFAVELVSELRKDGFDLELSMVGGDGPDINYKSSVEALSQELGVNHLIRFHGYCSQDRILEIIRDIPVVILPSLSEGIPNSILEGMSLRKLVVAGDGAGATRELVQHNVNGLLLPPKSKELWLQQLKKIFSTPARSWETIRDAGYNTWQTRFCLNNMMDGLISVYDSLGLLDEDMGLAPQKGT